MSDESWTFDNDGTWKISKQTVEVGDGGEPIVTTHIEDECLERRVGVKPSLPQLPYADGLCTEAFEDHADLLCAPRQIAAVLKYGIGTF